MKANRRSASRNPVALHHPAGRATGYLVEPGIGEMARRPRPRTIGYFHLHCASLSKTAKCIQTAVSHLMQPGQWQQCNPAFRPGKFPGRQAFARNAAPEVAAAIELPGYIQPGVQAEPPAFEQLLAGTALAPPVWSGQHRACQGEACGFDLSTYTFND